MKFKRKEENIPPFHEIYKQAREKLNKDKEAAELKWQTQKADEEPTQLYPVINTYVSISNPETLNEEILEIANSIPIIDEIIKKKLLVIAHKVKILQDDYDLLNNNIISLYHATKKKK